MDKGLTNSSLMNVWNSYLDIGVHALEITKVKPSSNTILALFFSYSGHGEIRLANCKTPLQSPDALKHLLLFHRSNAMKIFPSVIDREICVVVDLTDVGSDMNNGNAWRSTSATLGKIYNVTGAGEELRVWPGQGSNWYTVFRNRYTHTRYKD